MRSSCKFTRLSHACSASQPGPTHSLPRLVVCTSSRPCPGPCTAQDAAALAKPRDERNCRGAMLLPETRVAEVAYAVLSALQHMHSSGFAHCDMKPDNIFIMADNSVRLGDPGVASAPDADGRLAKPTGTYGYCSCEMQAFIDEKPCEYPVTMQTDMPGLARVLAACAAWHDDVLAWKAYLLCQRYLPAFVPEGLQELIGSMMAADPAMRPTPQEALANTWLVDTMGRVRWEQVQQQQEEKEAGVSGTAAAAGAPAESPADAWW